ncbi:MAG: 1-deoxy-D-xylulose-5-phosphate reductoisomerase, partial [Ignavibacteriaceae bacterium]|nr:1-deoxy-D-xylulose-5-phosphate reductoisomerase [Ignavibacteriaceae bacterium]
MKKVFILGSTGSIGVNCLNVISSFKDEFEVSGLTVNSNTELLLEQIKKFKPKLVVVRDENSAKKIYGRIPNGCELLVGEEGLIKVSIDAEYDIFMGAMVGFAG